MCKNSSPYTKSDTEWSKYKHLIFPLLRELMHPLNQCLTLPFSRLFLWVMVEIGVGASSVFTPPYLSSDSRSGSVFALEDEVRLSDGGDPPLGLLTGEFLWADGQLCWFRHTEHRGLTGRQTCCPKPTSSQLISLHSSLPHSEHLRVTLNPHYLTFTTHT